MAIFKQMLQNKRSISKCCHGNKFYLCNLTENVKKYQPYIKGSWQIEYAHLQFLRGQTFAQKSMSVAVITFTEVPPPLKNCKSV